MTFNDENQAELDVESIVKEVFKDKPNLYRSIIRSKMNQNQDIQ